jgi:hypothetical protein
MTVWDHLSVDTVDREAAEVIHESTVIDER